eukprot:GEZU01019763.1.p2 GENE.GEZU01019763.1~~GEZU01019763.1.p2  ORF type:complete len:102 (-),score=29.46 GEZU01019763.1:130-435(-)
MDLQAERKLKEAQAKQTIYEKLTESGEKERLKELLRNKLTECGWKDNLKAYCKDIIKNKGIEEIKVEELVKEITPHGREAVPDNVKAELLQRIREFIEQNS